MSTYPLNLKRTHLSVTLGLLTQYIAPFKKIELGNFQIVNRTKNQMLPKIQETEAFSLYLSHFRKLFDNAASGSNAAAKSVGNRVHQFSLKFESNFPLRFQDILP